MAWNKRARAEHSPAGPFFPSGKKGQSEDVFWFAFFYFPLTMFVVIALVLMPKALMEKSLQPVPLDEAIQARQLNSQLWATNMFTGRTSPFDYTDDLSEINKTVTLKQMAYKVSIDGAEAYYQKPFYNIAKPIAPFRYLGYTEIRRITVKGSTKKLEIEEYYPHQYALRPT